MKSTGFRELSFCLERRDCNQLGSENPDKIEKIFAEYLELENVDGKFVVRNLQRSNHLAFEKLEMNLE